MKLRGGAVVHRDCATYDAAGAAGPPGSGSTSARAGRARAGRGA